MQWKVEEKSINFKVVIGNDILDSPANNKEPFASSSILGENKKIPTFHRHKVVFYINLLPIILSTIVFASDISG